MPTSLICQNLVPRSGGGLTTSTHKNGTLCAQPSATDFRTAARTASSAVTVVAARTKPSTIDHPDTSAEHWG